MTKSTLLITGGTGSFGNAVLNKYLKLGLREIRIFSRDEKKQDEMRRDRNDLRIKFLIGDVRDIRSLRDAMEGVDFVFHAAALKQVPSCEFYPMEAVKTNVIGTDNVLQAAIDAKVRHVVVLSTDKAAYPINAMGISKAMMEKVMVAKARMAADRGTIICGTRYGNVLGSRGSVLPLFVDQHRKGLSLTVTDPFMTRFVMTLDDAVDLVEFAFKNGTAGDLFVQKAPSSTIDNLVQAFKRIVKKDLNIQIIGTRHGEKLYETLLTREERAKAHDLGGYFRVPADNRDLNYSLYVSEGRGSLALLEDYNSHNARQLSIDEVEKQLLRLPEISAIKST